MRNQFKGKKIVSLVQVPHDISIFESWHKRWMTFGNEYIQSAIYKRRPWKPLLYYIDPMTVLLAALPNCKQGLILGMGGGALIHYLQHYYPQLALTAVEINAIIIALAQQYFNIVPSTALKIVNEAAENFIAHHLGSFDVIYIDIYQPQHYPAACATPQFFQQCRDKLTETGVLSLNAVCEEPQYFKYLLHLVSNYVTKQTLCIPVPYTTNIIIHAFKGPHFIELLQKLRQGNLVRAVQWQADLGLIGYRVS